jgi:hypothetical protein
MSGSSSSSPAERPFALDQPLSLTVHSLPAPQEALAHEAQRTRRGRWRMLGVLLVCASPVIASYFTYYVVRPDARRNYGELIEPQRPVPPLGATALDGKPVALPALKGQWLLVSVADGACDAACERHLWLQRQLREGLGKDKDRVDWVWLVTGGAPVAERLRPALSQATVLHVDDAGLSQWLSPGRGHELADHLYLVDPMGNWMIRFPAGLDMAGAAKAKRDLERLLRASASWDQPGRTAP